MLLVACVETGVRQTATRLQTNTNNLLVHSVVVHAQVVFAVACIVVVADY